MEESFPNLEAEARNDADMWKIQRSQRQIEFGSVIVLAAELTRAHPTISARMSSSIAEATTFFEYLPCPWPDK